MGQADSKALNCNEKVFEKNTKYGTNRVIYLEDLVEVVDVHPQANIRQAKIKLRFYEWARRSRDEFERDYRRAIANLEKAAPNLKELRIEACYAHKPDLEALPEVCQPEEAKDTFESEAKLLQNRLEGLMYAWKGCQIQLYRVEFHVYWIVGKQAPDSTNFEQIGQRTFGPKVQLNKPDEDSNDIQWHYHFEDTAFFLTFHFVNENDHGSVPPGRCSWPR